MIVEIGRGEHACILVIQGLILNYVVAWLQLLYPPEAFINERMGVLDKFMPAFINIFQ